MTDGLRFHRVVLKLSGEVLQGSEKFGVSALVIDSLAAQIAEINRLGVEITVVIGGGNIFRGLPASQLGMDRADADYMGMMATVINGLALKDSLKRLDTDPRIFSALAIEAITEPFTREKAVEHLVNGGINIAVAGTGRPFFTTDTAAALRALETEADVLLKATRVDGVYDKDPEKHSDARFFEKLTFLETLEKNLRIMDLTAATLCRDNDMPVVVFDIKDDGNLKKVVKGDKIGTLITGGKSDD